MRFCSFLGFLCLSFAMVRGDGHALLLFSWFPLPLFRHGERRRACAFALFLVSFAFLPPLRESTGMCFLLFFYFPLLLCLVETRTVRGAMGEKRGRYSLYLRVPSPVSLQLRGCALIYTSLILTMFMFRYTCVVEMSEWPSISCTLRTSAPF